jgi:hypothetical protein
MLAGRNAKREDAIGLIEGADDRGCDIDGRLAAAPRSAKSDG